MESHSFRRVSGDSPETMRKLCLCTKFPHLEISRNCENCAFPQNFHTLKLGEITVFYVVKLSVEPLSESARTLANNSILSLIHFIILFLFFLLLDPQVFVYSSYSPYFKLLLQLSFQKCFSTFIFSFSTFTSIMFFKNVLV